MDDARLDFAAAWQAYTDRRHRARRTDEEDRALWASFAARYDDVAVPCEELLDLLKSLVRPGDALLDVGAGTGLYSLPLAPLVARVTALDHTPAMLRRLQHKAQERGIVNIHPVEAALEDATIAPHDVVLAAWSLYRQRDIVASLRKLVDAARRTLVIVDGDSGLHRDGERPHEAVRAEIWGGGPGIPNYLYFAGILWQIGVRAEVRVLYHDRVCAGATPGEVAAQVTPADATPEQAERFAQGLLPLIQHENGHYAYRYTLPVGVVIWNRRGPADGR